MDGRKARRVSDSEGDAATRAPKRARLGEPDDELSAGGPMRAEAAAIGGMAEQADATVGNGLRKREVLMLVQQALAGLGFDGAAQQLASESGITAQSREAAEFRAALWEGRFDAALALLAGLGLDAKALKEAQFLVLEEKLLEELSSGATGAAMRVLREDLGRLGIRQDRLHRLAGSLLCATPQALREHLGWPGTDGRANRAALLREVQKLVPAETMLPEGRLEVLLEQALGCQFPHAGLQAAAAPASLMTDYCCSRAHIPTRTTQVLTDHTDEVWHLAFSHAGRLLASASKDASACVWEVGPARGLARRHRLLGHGGPLTHCAWAPDDGLLATCSLDASVRVWEAGSGACQRAIQLHDAPVTSAAWLPSGEGLFTAAEDRRVHLTLLPSGKSLAWQSPGVNELLMLRDGRLLATPATQSAVLLCLDGVEPLPTELGRVRLLAEEGAGIVSAAASRDGARLLLNTSARGLHLWSVPPAAGPGAAAPAALLQRFRGPRERQSRYIVRSCFGGYNDSYVASGSEECKVFVWLAATGELLASLEGHSGTVNAVSWNPADPHMFASASDDRSIHVWGLAGGQRAAGRGVMRAAPTDAAQQASPGGC